MMAPDDFRDQFTRGLVHAYTRGWTTDKEADAIRREHEEKQELHEAWRIEQDRKRKAGVGAGLVVAGLVLLFLVLAALWWA